MSPIFWLKFKDPPVDRPMFQPWTHSCLFDSTLSFLSTRLPLFFFEKILHRVSSVYTDSRIKISKFYRNEFYIYRITILSFRPGDNFATKWREIFPRHREFCERSNESNKKKRVKKNWMKKKKESEVLERGASPSIRYSAFFKRNGYRVKFNAISRYIIPIILSRVIAHWTYGRAFIFRSVIAPPTSTVIVLFHAR